MYCDERVIKLIHLLWCDIALTYKDKEEFYKLLNKMLILLEKNVAKGD